MIKRPTIILLFVLALVIAAFFFIKSHPLKSSSPTPTATSSQFLVNTSENALISLKIENKQGDVVQLQRDSSQTWVVVRPRAAAADQSLAGAAETQVGALRIVTQLAAPPAPSDMGLDAPSVTIQLGFENNLHHTIEVGDLTPTGSGYYVRFDDGQIYVVAQSGIDSLLNLLTAPPYLPTEIPTETATIEVETVTPVMETVTTTP